MTATVIPLPAAHQATARARILLWRLIAAPRAEPRPPPFNGLYATTESAA